MNEPERSDNNELPETTLSASPEVWETLPEWIQPYVLIDVSVLDASKQEEGE